LPKHNQTWGIYIQGLVGVLQDYKEAVKWFRRAARSEFPEIAQSAKEHAHEVETKLEEQRIAEQGIQPERQKEFLNIVKTHADKYKSGKSEIKKSLYRKKKN